MIAAPTNPPARPAQIFRTALATSPTCPSIQIAAFTAHTNAAIVITAAATAAHRGFKVSRRTKIPARTANGTATSAIRKSPGAPTSLSISVGSSGVSRPVNAPPAAILSRSPRASARDTIVSVNALSPRKILERAKGIEPSYAAWEAAVLPLNYARKSMS
jgi:hypothetical protein